jgi:hypothetical protein
MQNEKDNLHKDILVTSHKGYRFFSKKGYIILLVFVLSLLGAGVGWIKYQETYLLTPEEIQQKVKTLNTEAVRAACC